MDMLHVVLVCLLAVAIAALLVAFNRKKEQILIAVHKWAGSVATAFAKAGLSQTVCAPLQALAAGDRDGAIGAGIHLAEYLKDFKNWEKEFLNMLQVALADPILGPKVKKLCGDIVAGADQKTIQADADDIESSSPLDAVDQANATLRDSVDHILHSKQHPDLADAIDNLPAGQKFLAGLLVAGKAAVQAATAAPDTPAPTPAAGSIPVPSGATVTIQHP